ncbi:DEAD/DEAH box helicase [bacterium]|jgi:ATP-dependent RNA helicase DeaD|nr:DEAD/DEAH box helicase [bacterium]
MSDKSTDQTTKSAPAASPEKSVVFADLGLSAPVLKSLQSVGYEQPTPVQAQCIPHLLSGCDVLGTAQTGTGKTAAFALPLLSKIDLSKSKPQVLVLAPTRELAIQVAEAFQTYASGLKGFHVLPVYGGQGMDTQLRQLRRGVHVVVGTPGRVMDHLRRKTLKLDELQTVVLDEADEMLRMGFIDDVEWILEHTPSERQVALFSATMPAAIRKIADTYLRDPQIVKIKTKTTTVAAIEQVYWTVSGTNKLDALTRMLEMEDFDGIIIFVRTKSNTIDIADKLEARGYSAAPINGDMSQQLRERTITQLKSGGIDILVATDVAARGIDVVRISHVVNFDVPFDAEVYTHRIGRTGRAGRSGKAILFVAPREKRLLKTIERTTGQSITPVDLPSREQVNKRRIEAFKGKVHKVLAETKLEFFHQLVQEVSDESNVDAQQLAAAFAYMAQQDKPVILPEEKRSARAPAKRNEGRASEGRRSDESSRRSKPAGGRPERASNKPSRPVLDEDGKQVDMETYRLAVGREHLVQPGDIVGAIANEAGIESNYIGRIQLFDGHSTVDLPAGMPKEVFEHLKKVRIRNQALDIERGPSTKKHSADARKPRRSAEFKPGADKKPSADKKPFADKKAGEAKAKRTAKRPMKKPVA